jgi:hypothetical protein
MRNFHVFVEISSRSLWTASSGNVGCRDDFDLWKFEM